jgi:CRP-like cAMP-binding protein
VAAGVLLLVCGLLTWPSLRALDRRAVLPDPERFVLFRELDIFRPVPQPALEQLVAAAVPLHVEAGEVLIREGDVGDRFYVVTSGHLEVGHGGRAVATLGPGSYVGEIALLRDVPRTATVVAPVATDLLAVDRDTFLLAVTGSRRGSRALDAEVDRRLAELRG